MKSHFTEYQAPEQIDWSKPQLLEFYKSDGVKPRLVVLTTGERNEEPIEVFGGSVQLFEAVVVYSTTPDWKVGDVNTEFDCGKFRKYNGRILLSND